MWVFNEILNHGFWDINFKVIFINFKSIIWWVLTYVYSCVIVTIMIYGAFLSPKLSSYFIVVIIFHHPWQPDLLSVTVILSFLKNEYQWKCIVLIFCVWLLSLVTVHFGLNYVVAYFSSLFLVIAFHLLSWWIFRLLPVLDYFELKFSEHLNVGLCINTGFYFICINTWEWHFWIACMISYSKCMLTYIRSC